MDIDAPATLIFDHPSLSSITGFIAAEESTCVDVANIVDVPRHSLKAENISVEAMVSHLPFCMMTGRSLQESATRGLTSNCRVPT